MIRINENLMGSSPSAIETMDWVEHTASGNYALFRRYYPLVKLPVSGILSISADAEFITPDPENISAVVQVKDSADSSWQILGTKTIPYTAGHRVKFEGSFNIGQVYEVGVGIYVGEIGKTDGNVVRIRRIKVEEGSVCTMWVPLEFALTPEQIATLPPYGDYKEIKTF